MGSSAIPSGSGGGDFQVGSRSLNSIRSIVRPLSMKLAGIVAPSGRQITRASPAGAERARANCSSARSGRPPTYVKL
jgi:hypothetical protein